MQELRSQKEPRGAARLRPAHSTQCSAATPAGASPNSSTSPKPPAPTSRALSRSTTKQHGHGEAEPAPSRLWGKTAALGDNRVGSDPPAAKHSIPLCYTPPTRRFCAFLWHRTTTGTQAPHTTPNPAGGGAETPPAARHHPPQLHPYLFDLPTPRAREDDGLAPVVVGGHRGHPVLLVHEQRRPLDGDGPAQRLVKILPTEIVVDLQGLREGKGER